MNTSVWLSLILGALFLSLAFWGMDFTALGKALEGANYLWLVPAYGVMFGLTCLRSWRLQFILRRTRYLPFWQLFVVNAIGFAAINLLPARLGEFMRPYLLLERNDVPLGAGLASILVERLFDFLAMVVMVFCVALFVDLPSDSVTVFGKTLPIIDVGRQLAIFLALPSLAFVAALFLFEKYMTHLMEKVARALLPTAIAHKVIGLIGSFLLAMGQIRDPRVALGIAGWTLAIWLFNPLAQLSILHAFGIDLGYQGAVAILACTLMGLLIPAPPGFAGNFEAFTLAGLLLFGITGEGALAYALVGHSVQFLSTVGFGLICLWKVGITTDKLVEAFRTRGGMKPEGS